jgi:two-component system nitrogen regulation response regulator GlnG
MRVVVVDNDVTWTDLVALDLGLEGHEVVAVAADTASALAALEAVGDVDVLVTDYRMPPGPNGLDLAERVLASYPGIHVVLFTNYLDPTLADRAASIGAGFVPKPDLRALRAAVSRDRPAAT